MTSLPRRQFLQPDQHDAHCNQRKAGHAREAGRVPWHAHETIVVNGKRGYALAEDKEAGRERRAKLGEDKGEAEDNDEATESADIEEPGSADRVKVGARTAGEKERQRPGHDNRRVHDHGNAEAGFL